MDLHLSFYGSCAVADEYRQTNYKLIGENKMARIKYGVMVHNYRTAMYGIFFGKKREMERVEKILYRIEHSEDYEEYKILGQMLFDTYSFLDEINFRKIDKNNIYTDFYENRYQIIGNIYTISY